MLVCLGQRAALQYRRLAKQKVALWGHNYWRDSQAEGASMTHALGVSIEGNRHSLVVYSLIGEETGAGTYGRLALCKHADFVDYPDCSESADGKRQFGLQRLISTTCFSR